MPAFPDTPVSLLSCIENRHGGMPYQTAWSTFFALYHIPLRLAVVSEFRRCKWHHVPQELLEDTMADIVVSFFKADFSYNPATGKFRNYLRQLVAWRVRDKITQHPIPTEPLDATQSTFASEGSEGQPASEILEEREIKAHQSALLNMLLEDVRQRVSPQTFLMFEMTKILGHSPESVAEQFNVKRNVVDNATFRILKKLKELGALPEYQREYFS